MVENTGYKAPTKVVQVYPPNFSRTAYSFANVDNVKYDDTSYAMIPSSGGVNNTHVSRGIIVTGFNFNIPSNAKVTGVSAKIVKSKWTNQGGVKDRIVQLINNNTVRVGTNKYKGDSWATKSMTNTYYGSSVDKWNVDLTPSFVNSSGFGLYLDCIGTSSTWATPAVDCMQLCVYYDVITYDISSTTPTSPVEVEDNISWTVTVTSNSLGNGTSCPVTISIPSGLQLLSATTSNGSYNSTTKVWNAVINGTTASITFLFKAVTPGTKILKSTINSNNKYTNRSILVNEPPYIPPHPDPDPSAVLNKSFYSLNGNKSEIFLGETNEFYINVGGDLENGATYGESYIRTGYYLQYLSFTPLKSVNVKNIQLIKINDNNYKLRWDTVVDENYAEGYDLNVKVLVRCKNIGSTFFNFYLNDYSDTTNMKTSLCKIINPPFNAKGVIVEVDGIQDDTEPNATFDNIPMLTSIQGCNVYTDTIVNAWLQKIQGYIGCVQLFEPHLREGLSNTTSNDLIEDTHHNRTNLGKKGNLKEDIGLSLYVNYKDVATLNSLVALDEPVPIDINPYSMQLDPLGHRGYGVISKVKSEPANSLYSKCDVDVRYLTHLLRPEMSIIRGTNLNKYSIRNQHPINVLDSTWTNIYDNNESVLDSFDDYIGTGCDVTKAKSGTTLLWGDEITVTGGSKVVFATKEIMALPCNISLDWIMKNSGTRKDKLNRMVRVLDEEGNYVLNYTLYGFDSSTSDIDVIIEKYVNNNVIPTYGKVKLINPPEDSGVTDAKYSQCKISINDEGILNLTETGLTGLDVLVDNIQLPEGNYHIEIEFNQDEEGTTYHRIGVELNETRMLNNQKLKYINEIVSSLPLRNKIIKRTRESEDGTLYYYTQDDVESVYISSPNLIYKGACNLTTEHGISVLENNFDVDPIVMTNGLVKVLFSRRDKIIRVSTFYSSKGINYQNLTYWNDVMVFRLDDMDNLKPTLSSDKVEVEVGGTKWSLLRGRPFIDVEHPNQKLYIHEDSVKPYIYHDGGYGEGLTIENIDKTGKWIDLNGLFYVTMYNPIDDGGIMIIKPNYRSIHSHYIPNDTKTVLVPYNHHYNWYDKPENLAVEWLNLHHQTIQVKG